MPRLPKLSTYHVTLYSENSHPVSIAITDTQAPPKRFIKKPRQAEHLTPEPVSYLEAKRIASTAKRSYFPDRYATQNKDLWSFVHTTGNYTSVVKRYQITSAIQTPEKSTSIL